MAACSYLHAEPHVDGKAVMGGISGYREPLRCGGVRIPLFARVCSIQERVCRLKQGVEVYVHADQIEMESIAKNIPQNIPQQTLKSLS